VSGMEKIYIPAFVDIIEAENMGLYIIRGPADKISEVKNLGFEIVREIRPRPIKPEKKVILDEFIAHVKEKGGTISRREAKSLLKELKAKHNLPKGISLKTLLTHGILVKRARGELVLGEAEIKVAPSKAEEEEAEEEEEISLEELEKEFQ